MDTKMLLLFCLFLSILQNVAQERLVVIDTDGGIDDALAILLTLTHQNTQVLAITCTFGDTYVSNSCENSLRELVLADNKEIPVHKGSPGSLTDGKYVSQVAYYLGVDGLGNRSHEFSTDQQKVSEIPAAVALSQLASSNPGSITLMAIGPLTNLALAHRIDPHFTHNLKEIVIMGGNYKGNVTDSADFNFKLDPLAANIILTEAACPVTLVPFETTSKFGIPWDKFDNEVSKIDTRFGRFFQRTTEVGSVRVLQRGDAMYFTYDFLAAPIVLYPECVTSYDLHSLSVEYEGRLTQGVTVVVAVVEAERTVIKIITSVNETFIGQMLYRLLASS